MHTHTHTHTRTYTRTHTHTHTHTGFPLRRDKPLKTLTSPARFLSCVWQVISVCVCVCVCVCCYESGCRVCSCNVQQSGGIYFWSQCSLYFSSGRDSGNPPRTRSEAACQRLAALASRALSDPRQPYKRTNRTASTAADQVVGARTSGKLGEPWGTWQVSVSGGRSTFWENICERVDSGFLFCFTQETHFTAKFCLISLW